MNLNVTRILFFCSIIFSGCAVSQDESSDEPQEKSSDEIDEELEIENEKEPADKFPKNENQNEKTDEGFDPCPSDVYTILDDNGVQYSVIIRVFCDPMQNKLNLGCPEPY